MHMFKLMFIQNDLYRFLNDDELGDIINAQ